MYRSELWTLLIAFILSGTPGCFDDGGPNGSPVEDCCACVQNNLCGGGSFSFGECAPDGYYGFALVDYDLACVAEQCDVECAEQRFRAAAGLHQDCPESGCLSGQDCITAAAPGGETNTCEISCAGEPDCPQGMRCNLPPLVLDSIADTCIENGTNLYSEACTEYVDGTQGVDHGRCTEDLICHVVPGGPYIETGFCTQSCDEENPCPFQPAGVTCDEAHKICIWTCDLTAGEDAECPEGLTCRTQSAGNIGVCQL